MRLVAGFGIARPALTLIALDEAAEEGEGLPQALADRLALFLDIDAFGCPIAPIWRWDRRPHCQGASAAGPYPPDPPTPLEQLTRVAHGLAIDSLRAPWLALMAARAHAALARRAGVERG